MTDNQKKTEILKIIKWLQSNDEVVEWINGTNGFMNYDDLNQLWTNLIENGLEYLIPIFISGYDQMGFIFNAIVNYKYSDYESLLSEDKDFHQALQKFNNQFKLEYNKAIQENRGQ